jgi:hypothetical protein
MDRSTRYPREVRGRAVRLDLVEALASQAAVASLPGSRMPVPDDIHRTAVRRDASIEMDLTLAQRS